MHFYDMIAQQECLSALCRACLSDTKLHYFVLSIGGSKGGHQGCVPPLGVQILSFSCSFWQKIDKIIGFWELAPPPWENPGSAIAK